MHADPTKLEFSLMHYAACSQTAALLLSQQDHASRQNA